MKYQNIKSSKLTHDQISQAFGFANRKSFDRTSAHKRYMAGVEKILEIIKEQQLKQALCEAGTLVINEARMFREEASKNASDNLKRQINPKYYPNPK